MTSFVENQIETTVEVESEIPESLKRELRRKRRRLKQKKSNSSFEKKSQEIKDLEVIKTEPYYGSDFIEELSESAPKVLPPILEKPPIPLRTKPRSLISPDSSIAQTNDLQSSKPVPPPRKSKKHHMQKKPYSPIKTDKEYDADGESSVTRKSDIISTSGQSIHDPSLQEITSEYFFTKVWDESSDFQPSPGEIDGTDGTLNDDTDSVGLIRKELQQKLSGLEVVRLERASYVPFSIRIEKERNSFFHPSHRPVPVKLKLPEGKEPINLAGEDLFHSRVPKIPQKNINKLENRLVAQKELQWFGEDGRMKMLQDPVSDSPIRHVIDEDNGSFPELEYVKASLSSDKLKLDCTQGKEYQLDLDISSLSFLHHPLFSVEHVIESRLATMCDKYFFYQAKNAANNLKQKLKALRTATNKLKLSLQKGMQETSITPERQSRLKQYQKEIRQMKRLRDLHEAEQKALWKSIVSTWEELSQCRQNQGFTSTSLNVKIHEKKPDKAVEKEEWDRELLDELEEEMEDYEASSEKLIAEYESSLAEWKQWNKSFKMAQKRQKLREKSSNDEEEDNSEAEMDLASSKLEDEKLLSEPERAKPKPAAKFDSAATMEKLKNNAMKMRRRPGEPILHISVDRDVPLTPSSQCPKVEAQRRDAASKVKLYFKIIFNDKKVSETCERNLSTDFKAVWGQIYKLRIVHLPQSFRIEIFEGGFFSCDQIAELFIAIPAATQTASNSKVIDHQFSSEKSAPVRYNAVGSGVSHKFHDGSETFLLTNGSLKCSLSWGVHEDGTVMVPPNIEQLNRDLSSPNILSFVKPENFLNIERLNQWIKSSNLDLHNPDNEPFFHLFQELGLDDDEPIESVDCFRLEPFNDELEFCSMDDIDNNKRFQLLHFRDQDVGGFKNLKMIPNDEKDITEEMLQCLKNRESEVQKKDTAEKEQREQAKLLMQRVREEVAKRFYVSQHQRMLEDIVTEEKVPSIGMIGFSLLKLFQRKRPLYPERKDRKKMVPTNLNIDVKVIVRILHASNVPVRKDNIQVKDTKNKETAILFESHVQPFVEVMFQRTSKKTTLADGPHPTWNQELELPFCAPNSNYSPASLESVRDYIYINLFDEVTMNLLEGDDDRDSVVHERLERRWLGNLKIPFTTLYLNSKIEGTFKINVPPVLLGYENEPRPWMTGLSDSSTYISFFMTIEPCLQLPDVFRDQFDSTEPVKVLLEVEKWRESVIDPYPDRIIKLMSVDLSGKFIFVTRFLRPLIPPEELLTGSTPEIMESLARFVSLIPTVSDSITFPGLCDIWSTSDQFLQMLTGDEEEHALLLCSFFLHLHKKAMLLLGSGIPEGPTAYVVTYESDVDVILWNASSGERFHVGDNNCPLQSVGCIISADNVWANIQRNSHPSRISFDLSKTSDWKSFFSRSFPNPGLRSIQPSELEYISTDPEYVSKLQEKMESRLKESIERWRQNITTVWNANCNRTLYKILARLERNVGRTASDDSLQELESILSKYKMDGFPLTTSFSDVDAIVETVFTTGLHLTEDKKAEFSVAVYIHPYPCCVLAVWVYIAVLIPRIRNEDVLT